jgi:uncharacterized protein YkwD
MTMADVQAQEHAGAQRASARRRGAEPRSRKGAGRRAGRLATALLAVVVTVAGSLGLVTGTAAAAPSQLTSFDQQLIKLVNEARSRAGLPAVVEARGLTRLSVDWSTRMANENRLRHNPDAWTQVLSYGASNRTAWAENVGRWSSDAYSPEEAFGAYMDSPGHRANILGTQYRYIGMGTITGVGEDDYNTMTFTDRVDPGQAVDGSSGGGASNPLLGCRDVTV